MIVAIDPGKNKCGLAVLDENGKVLEKKVAGRGEFSEEVKRLISSYNPSAVVIGRGAYGSQVARELAGANLIFVSEKDSSWQARKRYWKENPPSGWLKLVPTSLRLPPVPVDDLAAVILGECYLKS